MKKYSICLLVMMIWVGFDSSTTFACSGAWEQEYSFETQIDYASVVVRGSVIENNAGNSILHVERYLKGSGSEYLLIYRENPNFFHSLAVERYTYGNCVYPEDAIAEEHRRAYFILNGGGGVYRIWSYNNMLPISEDEEGTSISYTNIFDYSSETDSYTHEGFRYNQLDFENYVAELVGGPSTRPSNSDYPRFKPLYITSESGQRYQMPINGYNLIEVGSPSPACTENCVVASPDNDLYAYPVPNSEDTYSIWYRDLSDDQHDGFEIDGETVTPYQVTAQALSFSPHGEFLLAWDNDELSLYRTYDFGIYSGYVPQMYGVWRVQLATNETFSIEDIRGQVIWNNTSSSLMYIDAEGLHLLDLESVLIPELVLEMGTLNPEDSQTEIRPEILELSTTGRYIRYGTAQEWSLLDSVTGQVYDDALITPDETRFVQIAPEESISSTIDTTDIVRCPDTQTIPYPCSGGIGIIFRLPQTYQVQDIYWRSVSILMVVACEIEDTSSCDILNVDIDSNAPLPRPSGEYMNDYVYDADFGVMAWAVDDYFLHFNINSRYGGFDLSEYLDSPIASIEWGETLWYVER